MMSRRWQDPINGSCRASQGWCLGPPIASWIIDRPIPAASWIIDRPIPAASWIIARTIPIASWIIDRPIPIVGGPTTADPRVVIRDPPI
jgi:hypothetical protein